MGKGIFIHSFWLPFSGSLPPTGYTQNVYIQKLLASALIAHRILAIVRDSGAAAAPSQFMARGIFLVLFCIVGKMQNALNAFQLLFNPLQSVEIVK